MKMKIFANRPHLCLNINEAIQKVLKMLMLGEREVIPGPSVKRKSLKESKARAKFRHLSAY